MKENDGEPNMITAIISNLQARRAEAPYPFHNFASRTLQKAIRHQDQIGWFNFIEGFLSRKWRELLETHFEQINSKKSPLLWMSRLQQKLWGIMKAMWKDRNDTLHGDGNAVHRHEMRDLVIFELIN